MGVYGSLGIALYGFEGYTVEYEHILRWMSFIFFLMGQVWSHFHAIKRVDVGCIKMNGLVL